MNNPDWGYFGCSRKYPENSILCTKYSENGNETSDGSHIIEGKIYVYKLSWLKVGYIISCICVCVLTGLRDEKYD